VTLLLFVVILLLLIGLGGLLSVLLSPVFLIIIGLAILWAIFGHRRSYWR
jgi:hypothetical protein